MSLQGMIEKNIYERIIDIFNESFIKQRTPKIKERMSFEIVGGKTLLVDIPKKSKLHYHSSSYTIECEENKKRCRTEGILITDLDTGDEVKKKFNDLGCDVIGIHNHDTKSVKSTHIHFICKDKSYDESLKIVRLIGKY